MMNLNRRLLHQREITQIKAVQFDAQRNDHLWQHDILSRFIGGWRRSGGWCLNCRGQCHAHALPVGLADSQTIALKGRAGREMLPVKLVTQHIEVNIIQHQTAQFDRHRRR